MSGKWDEHEIYITLAKGRFYWTTYTNGSHVNYHAGHQRNLQGDYRTGLPGTEIDGFTGWNQRVPY